jgi:hypothetical protein
VIPIAFDFITISGTFIAMSSARQYRFSRSPPKAPTPYTLAAFEKRPKGADRKPLWLPKAAKISKAANKKGFGGVGGLRRPLAAFERFQNLRPPSLSISLRLWGS